MLDLRPGVPIDELYAEPLIGGLGAIDQWSLRTLGIPEAWRRSTGKGVRIAVLDTWCDPDHGDLGIVDQIDTTGEGLSPRLGRIPDHCTWCAGMIVAKRDGKGTAGIAYDAEVHCFKVLRDAGWGDDASIARGFDGARERQCHIASASLGGQSPMPLTAAAIRRYVQSGGIVVAAAGNEGLNPFGVSYPARLPEALAIGAHDRDGNPARFSSRGKHVDLSAPGVDMISTIPGNQYGRMSGTSMATPVVAGVIALLLSSGYKFRSVDDLRRLLWDNASQPGKPGVDNSDVLLRVPSLDTGGDEQEQTAGAFINAVELISSLLGYETQRHDDGRLCIGGKR